VKAALLTLATICTLLLPACAKDAKEAAAREWQRNECNRVLDKEDRDRCLKRADGR
jgi:outer membrane biogenesis lipoprotein LolB